MNTKQNHQCEFTLPHAAYGDAINACLEKDGQFWVGNGEYASQVNYCPFCGVKAPIQFDLVPLDKTPSEEDKILAALIEDAKNNPIPDDWMRNWQ